MTDATMPANGPITATGVPGFLQWLQQRQPYLYKRVQKKLPKRSLAGLGDDAPIATVSVDASLVGSPDVSTSSSSSSSISDLLSSLVMGAGQVVLTKTQLDAQQKILNMQLDRARAGLPPLNIDPTQYGLPAPNVKLGLDAPTQRLVLIGAGVIGGGLLLWAIFGGGRRRRSR